MIKIILDALNFDEFYGVSKTVDFAKGSMKLEHSFKAIWKQEQRKLKARKYGRQKDN